MGWLRDQVLRHADIVEVVSQYPPPQKAGLQLLGPSPPSSPNEPPPSP
ncbi:MAG: hypothetical protein KatS3mg026_0469 [Bacteroidia bacterium]|nr:MAG: hypothetical protein KatS3mg026_0469 [Bacteroidia bacterium]